MKFLKKQLLSLTILILLLSPVALFAQGSVPVEDILGNSLDQTAGNSGVQQSNIPDLIGGVINALFAIVGIVFLAFSIIGGLLWMMAGGSEEKVTKAKKFIIGGIEGLIVMFMSYALVYVVLQALNQGAS